MSEEPTTHDPSSEPAPSDQPKRGAEYRFVVPFVLIIVLALAVFSVFGRRERPVFADALAALKSAETAAFDLWIETPSADPQFARVIVRFPDRLRTEIPVGPSMLLTLIFDAKSGQVLRIAPEGSSAAPSAEPEVDLVAAMGWLEDLRRIEPGDEEHAASENIGRKPMMGFLVRQPGHEWTIWVDSETRRPVKIKLVQFEPSPVRATFSDVILDEPMDPSLFAMDPPASAP